MKSHQFIPAHTTVAEVCVGSKKLLFATFDGLGVIKDHLPEGLCISKVYDLGSVKNEDLKDTSALVLVLRRYSQKAVSAVALINGFANQNYLPLVVLSESISTEDGNRLISAGAADFFNHIEDLESFVEWISLIKQVKVELGEMEIESGSIDNESSKNGITIAKRAFDIFFSSLALIILSPLLCLIAVVIKLESRGPVFYISQRAGSGYKIFDFYKFRSMIQDADKQLDEYQHLNQYNKEDDNVFVKLKKDPRVTTFGRLLRKTSLDELPQLINVLKGDMSIVGNRPLPLYEAKFLTKDNYSMRFMAPAGITGLWQVTKRGNEEMSNEERIQLDISYATKGSFMYDLGLLSRTIPAMIQKEQV
jgi:lipopolysaccharide/colanic/teichoic acid biosynthesis glycosyltransferase